MYLEKIEKTANISKNSQMLHCVELTSQLTLIGRLIGQKVDLNLRMRAKQELKTFPT